MTREQWKVRLSGCVLGAAVWSLLVFTAAACAVPVLWLLTAIVGPLPLLESGVEWVFAASGAVFLAVCTHGGKFFDYQPRGGAGQVGRRYPAAPARMERE